MDEEVRPAARQDVTDKKHWLAVLKDARTQISHYKALADQAKSELLDGFTADVATIDNRPVFTVKRQVQRRIDTSSFRETHPELAEAFTTETTVESVRLVGES